MSLFLKLDSSGRGVNQPTDNFTIQYPNLDVHGSWEVALVKLHTWYSYHNVSSDFGNNIVRYSTDGGATWEADIVIPNGIYSIENINSFIQSVMNTRGDWNDVDETYYLSIDANWNTLRVDVTLSNNYQLDFTAGSICTLFGFTSKIVTASESGTLPMDITNGTNSLELACDLTDSGYSNQYPGPTMYSFVPQVGPGSAITVAPNPPIYLPVNKEVIHQINVKVTNQVGSRINLNGESLTVMLHLRKIN